MSDSAQTDTEPCRVCGEPVRTQEPGLPKAEPLCGGTCIAIDVTRSGGRLVKIEDYLNGER